MECIQKPDKNVVWEVHGFILYRIYSENGLLYLGRSSQQPLHVDLHGHFFNESKKRNINMLCVTKIEFAVFPTEADMLLYEVYEINKQKPPLNHINKAGDEITVKLSEPEWHEYDCELLNIWREQIRITSLMDEEKQHCKNQLEQELKEKHRQITECEELTKKEKEQLFREYLMEYFEPVRNALL